MKKISILIFLLLIIFIIGYTQYNQYLTDKIKIKTNSIIQNNYNQYVKVLKTSTLYDKNNKVIGLVTKDKILKLSSIKNNLYKIDNTSIYIKYNNVEKTNYIDKNTRYKSYIPFNENIKTNSIFSLFQDKKLVFRIDKQQDFKIIIKEETGIYIEYLNELYFIKNSDIDFTYKSNNTLEEITTEIPVTVYHFLYKEGEECNEIICHSMEQIRDHFNYLKNNNYLTITTKELELFIKNKINLPKNTILITIDDGARAENFIPLLEEYNLKATLFLVTSWYDKNIFNSPNLEVASHTDNLHDPGVCPLGQGSALTCQEKEKLLDDLKKSREYLNNTEAFCFPFYEYNNYALDIVKEAGFKVAFIGTNKKVTRNIDPFLTPRITIHKYTSLEEYINLIT